MKSQNHDGLYVKAEIYQKNLYCLVDTGASMSVIHSKIYKNLSNHTQNRLEPYESKLKIADGRQVQPLGKIKLPLAIDNQIIWQNFIVAEIDLPIVLGYDFLYENKCIFDVLSQSLVLNNMTVNCDLESQIPRLCRITIDQKVIIPARSEEIIHAKPVHDIPLGTTVVMDGTSPKLKNKGILVAQTIYNIGEDKLPVRVINMSDKPQVLYKNTCAGTAEPLSPDSILSSISNQPECGLLPEHLQMVIDKCKTNLDDSQYQAVKQLLSKNSKAIAYSKKDLGHTDMIQHTINTGNAQPIKQNPRRVPLSLRQEVNDEIQRMLDGNIIRSSISPWSSPIVVVRKKDQSIRLCIDFRKVNDVTVNDSYPLPKIEDCLDALRGNNWFSTLDLCSGYHQVGMDPHSAQITSFGTSRGLFEFTRMPFGLCNAGATFSRLMEYILSGLQWGTWVVYLDDIIVFSQTFEDHISKLDSVFKRIQEAGLKIAPKKCFIFQKQVSFLGHVVNSQGISSDPSKIEAVKSWPIPSNVKEVRAFLGTCSYYRKFIKDFSKIAKCLHRLTEKNVIFKWNQECNNAFETLKKALITSPILSYPSMEKELILDTDASDQGVGAVISHLSDQCILHIIVEHLQNQKDSIVSQEKNY